MTTNIRFGKCTLITDGCVIFFYFERKFHPQRFFEQNGFGTTLVGNVSLRAQYVLFSMIRCYLCPYNEGKGIFKVS